MSKAWAEQGDEVTVIAGTYNITEDKIYDFCKGRLIAIEDGKKGVKVIRAYTPAKYNKNFLWRAWAYFTYFAFGLLGVLLYARGKYDVVLASSPPLTVGPLGVMLSFFKRCPLIFEVRDLWPESAIDTGVLTNPLLIRVMYFMERISYRNAAAINVLTPAFKEALIHSKGIAEDKVWMIPNAADLDIIKPGPMDESIRARHGWADRFVVFYMGAHGKANCLWQLINAAGILRKEPEYLIVCIGSGMERDALINKAKEEGLTNISFLPAVRRDEVNAYLSACDVSIIVLKKIDTFKTVYPNKMFDSMSAAKPIILAIDGEARKLVVDEAKCGVYVEPENALEIAEKIRFYKTSPQTARQHGENGYKYVCEHYDRRKLAAKYRELIQQRVIKV
jgi:glycosyltransferase involved in cell wall biosynthesis